MLVITYFYVYWDYALYITVAWLLCDLFALAKKLNEERKDQARTKYLREKGYD